MAPPSYDVVRLEYLIGAPFSLLGTAFITLLFLSNPSLRKTGINFILFQAICDFCLSLKLLIGACWGQYDHYNPEPEDDGGVGCIILGVMGQFFSHSTVAWNFMITVRTVLLLYAPHIKKRWISICCHLYVWSFGCMSVIVISALQQWGPTDFGCWIRDYNNPLRIALMEGPAAVYFVLSVIGLLLVFWRLAALKRQMGRRQVMQKELQFKRQMIAYILISILCWGPNILDRTLEWIGVTVDVEWIYLAVMLVALQGFMNSLVWLASDKLLTAIKDYLPCCHTTKSSAYQLVDSKGETQPFNSAVN